MEKLNILKVLVGSHAHGLNNPDSDFDYRGVFMVSTSEILGLDYKEKQGHWELGHGVDDTSYELHHFLHLASKSNPSILEVLVSPVIGKPHPLGEELRSLLPYMWSSNDVYHAFNGYAHNQRKKFLEDKDERPWKYACAQIRTLLLGIELLKHGTMTVNIKDQMVILGDHFGIEKRDDNIFDTLMAMKNGYFRDKGFVIDWSDILTKRMKEVYDTSKPHITDKERLNSFLLRARKEHW